MQGHCVVKNSKQEPSLSAAVIQAKPVFTELKKCLAMLLVVRRYTYLILC